MSKGNSPAFPCQDKDKQIWTGMNLRDYLALEAMHGLLEADHVKRDDIPAEAYRLADLMLDERMKYK
jgi:hypothetical protein